VLRSLDEVGLVALANKGLVRRAVKDLSACPMSYTETDDAVVVRGPDFTVIMPPDGPVKASDDTKASGVTRQILMAAMFLRDGWAAAEAPVAATPAPAEASTTPGPAADLEAALLEITHAHLLKWAGKNVWHEALLLAEARPRLEVETAKGLAIRFVDHEIEARILPGSDTTPARILDGMLTTASKTVHARWVVAAVLAFQQHKGRSIARPRNTLAPLVKDAPQTRPQIFQAVRRLLEVVLHTGLAHPSDRLQERFLTLSISALGGHLPRLGRMLSSLADEVSRLLARDAKGDASRLFDRMCHALALTHALERADPQIPLDLAGRSRAEYDPAGDLSLVGVAAFPWQTASGFRGLTLLCWDEQAKTFRSWSTSRALSMPGQFDLTQAYATDAVWPGGGAPNILSRSRFLLRSAPANYQGRLSASQQTTVADLQPAAPHELDVGQIGFRSWSRLAEHARRIFPIGLKESNPLESFVVLYPSRFHPCVFDELGQRLVWTISDEADLDLDLTLTWARINEPAIEFLEQVKPDRDRLKAVVARLFFTPAGLTVEPAALWSEGASIGNDHVLNPAFDLRRIQSKHLGLLDRLREKYGRTAVPTTMQLNDDEEGALAPSATLPAALESRFSELESLLFSWAERGVGLPGERDAERLSAAINRFSELGLDGICANLSGALSRDNPLALLWCGYLQRTYRQACCGSPP
jgi:hypothetical protein